MNQIGFGGNYHSFLEGDKTFPRKSDAFSESVPSSRWCTFFIFRQI